MMENKQKTEFPTPEYVAVELGRKRVLVKPFLDAQTQNVLASVYIQEFFNLDEPMRVFNAERALAFGLLDYCTNISVLDNDEPLVSLDDIYGNFDFLERVRKTIRNYNEFRATLRMSLDEINREHELSESIGKSLKVLVAQIVNFINEFDSSPEKIEELKSLLREANDSEVLKAITSKIR